MARVADPIEMARMPQASNPLKRSFETKLFTNDPLKVLKQPACYMPQLTHNEIKGRL
jgi:hypothetical protein